ncbi:MAG: zf-TFIIB domain-containing protein [Gammaproteobacteria bacterium]|nr:zf-TFIIB domain-containing protein [Gammaproteobacteria bacterium]
MLCPKCDAKMEEVTCEDVVIDRCSACKGIWFDSGEAETLSKKWIAEFIDTGDTEVGRKLDALDTISCPRCGETMRRFFDIDGIQLQFEKCDGHGQFFDAGEFTLWAENHYL